MVDEWVFRAMLLALYAFFAALRIYHGLKVLCSGGKVFSFTKEAAEREGRFNTLVGWAMEVLMPASVLLYVIHPHWVEGLSLPFPVGLRVFGAALSLACLLVLIYVHHSLGRHWSASLHLREQHELVTGGAYARVRHPMYTLLFGNMAGFSLVAANWLVLLPRVVQFAHLYARIGREEAMMTEHFGDAYRAYMSRTGRLLPQLRR
jgi:protein-S-isoprenylcysteine O-methyltransferase Ste14